MTPERASELLLHFLAGSPPFDRFVSGLSGHASSAIPDAFVDWLLSNCPNDRAAIVEVLVESILEGDTLVPFLPEACSLLTSVSSRLPKSLSPKLISRIEEYMQQGDRMSNWLEDVENENDRLKNYRTRWRYALFLWGVLERLKSPAAQRISGNISKRAKDPHFIRSVELTKRVMGAS